MAEKKVRQEEHENDLSDKILGTAKGLGRATKRGIANQVDKQTTGMDGSIFYVFRWVISFFAEMKDIVKNYFAERRLMKQIEQDEKEERGDN